MQRAAFPELRGSERPRRHRRKDRPDRVLVGLKIATSLAAAGLVGVVVLLLVSSGGDSREASVAPPAVPTIIPATPDDDAPGFQPNETTSLTVLDPPALRTETAEIAASPPPPPPPPPASTTSQPAPTTTRSSRRADFQFAVIGEHCGDPGAISVTEDYEPVMCARRSPRDRPRWVPMF